MSGWIKLEKELREDRRFTRMVDALIARQNVSVTSVTQMRFVERNAVTLVLGGLAQLWMFADSHIREDDTLDITSDEIDQLVGIEGFAELMPSDWLEIVDTDRVRLPSFQAHNGTDAKKKALTAKRVQRHRIRTSVTDVTQEKRTIVTGALPDQTKPDQTKPDQRERDARTRAESGGVIDCGTALTQNLGDIALEVWRRDVPECNPEAFSRWIVHRESRGRPMAADQRLFQAKQLAGNGDFAAQGEVVEYCIGQGWYSLAPLADVRARRDGMSRGKAQKERWRPPDESKAGAA